MNKRDYMIVVKNKIIATDKIKTCGPVSRFSTK